MSPFPVFKHAFSGACGTVSRSMPATGSFILSIRLPRRSWVVLAGIGYGTGNITDIQD